MGQAIGKARLHPGAEPFVNLPHSLIISIGQTVYEIAEGFGISKDELKRVVQISLHEWFSRLSESSIDECSEALFGIFSSDDTPTESKDNLIDSFELMATLCLISGMQLDQKIEFIFNLFDFNESGQLNINEATLAFRSIVSGTTKISCTKSTSEVDTIDKVAMEGFELSMPENLKHSHAMIVEDHSMNRQDFFNYVLNCSETVSLLNQFDDIIVEEISKTSVGIDDEKELGKLIPLRFPTSANETRSADEPWKDQLRFLQSSVSEGSTSSPPKDGLTLTWIYGRNATTPALYCSDGSILHAAGSIVVKTSIDAVGKESQEYFMGHSGHVTSIDAFTLCNDVEDFVASADTGSDCRICVWSPSTLSSIVTIPCFHQNGVAKLKFSSSGELLLSLGNNELNSIAVHHWRQKQLLFTAKLPGTAIYDCDFLGSTSDNSFGVCTTDAVYFWNRLDSKKPYEKRRGVFNRLSTKEVMTSITCVGGQIITGSLTGRVWLWEGRVCVKQVEAFRSGPITQIYAHRSASGKAVGLCVATHGGSIHLLNDKLGDNRRFVPNKRFGESERIVDAICWHPKLERLLIGQNGNSLYQMNIMCDDQDLKVITCGHHEVQGMAMRGSNVITVGNHKMKVWNEERHAVQHESSFEATLSCVSYSRYGKFAVGFGADDARSSLEKSFVILNGEDDLQPIHYGGNSIHTLTVCKFSDDGNLLAFGSADANIYIHSCTEKGYPLLAKCRGHSSPVSHIDFGCERGSDVATVLQSNSVSGEAMFWTTRGKVQTPLSQRDTEWETQTCAVRASIEGAHKTYDKHKVTSCCPFLNDRNQSAVIVGDSNGSLRVFSNPVAINKPLFLEYHGHSGSVQSALAAPQGSIYTMSQIDSCVVHWKQKTLTWDEGLPSTRTSSKKQLALPSSSMDMGAMINQLDNLDSISQDTGTKLKNNIRKPRPWTRSIVAPTNHVPNEGPLPSSQLILERIHGHDGNVKNNLHHLSECKIIYTVGKMLVKCDLEEDKQSFYHVEGGEITCLSVNQKSSICAIGHHGSSSTVTVVDLETMTPLSFLTGHTSGVLCVDIDDSGRYVASVSNTQEILVHDAKHGAEIASSHTYGETLDLQFIQGSSDRFVECGVCFVRYWSVKGSALSFDEANLDSLANKTQFYSCIGWNGTNLVVGTSSGDIIQFVESKPDKKRIKAHSTEVTNIASTHDGFVSSSSSVDGLKVWNSSFRCMLSVDLPTITTHQISSISWAKDNSILVGTTGNEVWQLSSESGTNLQGNGKALVSAHAASPIGLSVHPNGTFATSGDDGMLRIWKACDSQGNKSMDLGMASRACAFFPEATGRMIAVGFGKPVKDSARTINGKWAIIKMSDNGDGQIIAERRDVKKYVTEMKWHGNGDRLAVASFDKKICVYSIATETKPAIKVDINLLSMMDLTSPAIHLDFSRDSKYLRVNYQSNELHFFEAGPGLHIKESSRLKDTEWETETCIFSWNVQGIWPKEDGSEIITLDCSGQSIASGDRLGRLKLHQFPTVPNSQYIAYPAHHGPVGNLRWVPGGYLASTGEKDNAIMIWRQEVDDGCGASDNENDSPPTGEVSDRKNAPQLSNEIQCHSAVYDSNGQVVYSLSGNCIVLDRRKHDNEAQDSFQKHDTTVTALCTSHSRQLLASSDARTVRVWDSRTCTEVALLEDERQLNVAMLAFSSDDKQLLSISSGESKQVICVWTTLSGRWDEAHLGFQTLAGREKVHFCNFLKSGTQRIQIVSGGDQHVNFWSEQSSTLVVSKGSLPNQCANYKFLCQAIMNGNLITGTDNGSLLVWQEKTVEKEVQAHNESVVSLCTCPEGLVSGCAKGSIIIWSNTLQKVTAFDITGSSPSPAICSIDITPHFNGKSTVKILARTQSGAVLEISCVTGNITILTGGVDCSSPDEVVVAAVFPSN